ncbi:hypothetical protein P7C70_g4379, partial [Phenoliferia sp. Uapishka_3]
MLSIENLTCAHAVSNSFELDLDLESDGDGDDNSPDNSDSDSSDSPPPVFDDSNLRPDLPPATAQSALRKLVALELKAAGFDAAHPDALDDLDGILWSFFGSLLIHAHELAELGKRLKPNLKDVIRSCEELGVGGVRELTQEIKREKPYDAPGTKIHYDKVPISQSKIVTLDSDSEDDPSLATSSSATTSALTSSFLPPLPSRHSYRQTPVFPKSSIAPPVRAPSSVVLQTPSAVALAHISTLRMRLSDSQLVAKSLRNLIRKTSAREEALGVVEEDGTVGSGEGTDGWERV